MTEIQPPYVIDVDEVVRVDRDRTQGLTSLEREVMAEKKPRQVTTAIVIMVDHRCEKCGRIIARGQVLEGMLEIKCRCNHLQRIAA